MNFHSQIAMRGSGSGSGALGTELWNEPGVNPPVAVVGSAWDFATCTYRMQPGDTIDGIAQTYGPPGTPAGDWQGAGGNGVINWINQSNLDNPDIASGHQEKLQVGTPLHMTGKAAYLCANAPDKIKATCGPKQVFQDNLCKNCPPHSTPDAQKAQCWCDDGYVMDGKGGCMPAPPPPPNTTCPQNQHWDGAKCADDQPVPPVPAGKVAPTQASFFGSPWVWAGAAAVFGGFLLFSEKDRKKKKSKTGRGARR